MQIQNATSGRILIEDLPGAQTGSSLSIAAGKTAVIFNEDAEKSAQLEALLNSGALVNVGNAEPSTGQLNAQNLMPRSKKFYVVGPTGDFSTFAAAIAAIGSPANESITISFQTPPTPVGYVERPVTIALGGNSVINLAPDASNGGVTLLFDTSVTESLTVPLSGPYTVNLAEASTIYPNIPGFTAVTSGPPSPGQFLIATTSTPGTCVSAASPTTDMTVAFPSGYSLNIAVDGQTVGPNFNITSANTGSGNAANLQAAVRANVPGATGFTCVFSGGLYVMTSGTTGTSSAVSVSFGGGPSERAAVLALKLGIDGGGAVTYGTTTVNPTLTFDASASGQVLPINYIPVGSPAGITFIGGGALAISSMAVINNGGVAINYAGRYGSDALYIQNGAFILSGGWGNSMPVSAIVSSSPGTLSIAQGTLILGQVTINGTSNFILDDSFVDTLGVPCVLCTVFPHNGFQINSSVLQELIAIAPAFSYTGAGGIGIGGGFNVLSGSQPVSGGNVGFSGAAIGGCQVQGNLGQLGVNNPNPQYGLDVGGDINCSGQFRVNGTPISGGGGGSPVGTILTGFFNSQASGGAFMGCPGIPSSTSDNTNGQIAWPVSCTLKAFYINVKGPHNFSETVTINSNTSIQASITIPVVGAGNHVYNAGPLNIPINAGDLINFAYSAANGGAQLILSAQFA